ncbi:MAG: diguanylate cyclase [Fibrobacter sp.]|nr:diguanylate cyclase [Fibrobacter sp.]
MGRLFPKQRLVILVGLLYFIMNLVSISLFTYVINNNQAELISDNTRYQAKELMGNIVSSLKIGDSTAESLAQESIGNAFKNIDLPYVIYQNDSVIKKSDASIALPADYLNHTAQALSLKRYSGAQYYAKFHSDMQWLDFYVPVSWESCANCSVFSRVELKEFGRRFKALYKSIAITITVLTFLHLVFGIILHSVVIRPILKIHEATQKVADGELGYRLSINRDDELGKLANAFNDMTKTMQEQMISLKQQMHEIEQARDLMEKMSITDELTSLYNRRHLFDRLNHHVDLSKRHGNKLGLFILDIDFFKKVNDTYGHQVGDLVLVEISKLLIDTARSTDLVARYGGEELVVLCPETELENTIVAAYRVRIAIENHTIKLDDGQELKVTASIGVAEYQALSKEEGTHPTIEEFVEAADAALYRAKKGGRNRVDVFNIG